MLIKREWFRVLSPKNWVGLLRGLGRSALTNTIFIVVLYLYVVRETLAGLTRVKWIGRVFKLVRFDWLAERVNKLMRWLDFDKKNQVSRSYLIELAFRNMKSRKVRSTVTIGGVALGVGGDCIFGVDWLRIGKTGDF
jgi:hypothetical protein